MDDISSWFFKGWDAVARVALIGTLAYVGLLITLRISGKRTLSKMNAFDLVVTVALGSTLATILLSRQTGLADGLMAFMTLTGLQYAVAWLSVRSKRFRQLIKSEPSLLFYQGEFLKQTMRQQRIVEGEVLSAIRSAHVERLADVQAVVLETDGSFSVIRNSSSVGRSSLDRVVGQTDTKQSDL
ncbi:DUF421 domain-containing protein [Larkinella sp. VNQ87]|uniref:DUF421 domain-containing protein n=1 Tax=Larkinella sp. VNQ87 TaxID=3400921 RepID=UPI003C05E2A5